LLRALFHLMKSTFQGAPYNHATEDHGDCGRGGVVSHAGSPLLADLADVTTPMAELAEALDRARDPQPRRDPGRVLVDLAVAVANGGEAVGDITVLANQPPLKAG
jgi:hypothetical protein